MNHEKNIRKHVAIIHAYSLMSALQRKIVNVLLYEAINNIQQFCHRDSVVVETRIPLTKLSKAVNFNSNNTQYLKESIDSLASLTIAWNLLKDKVPADISFLNLRVLHGSPTFYQDGTFNFSFHKIMLDLANNPSIYGTIDLEIQSHFESKYGHALYENSTRFVNLQRDKIISLDIFRKLLGVDENKYSSMREFTRNVINIAVEEVNELANFVVDLAAIKVGKKISGYEISVKNKSKPIKCNQDEKNLISKEVEENFGKINNRIMEKILMDNTEEYIREKIIYTKQYARRENDGFYPLPYFISALRNDYKSKVPTEQQEKPPLSQLDKVNFAWREKLQQLHADLNHWKVYVDFAKTANNEPALIQGKKMVIKCEEKLREHLLTQPEQETA